MEEQEVLRKRIEDRVEGMIGFYKHLGSYMVVNLLLFCIWLWQNYGQEPTFPWFVFPLGGWGIGLLFHYLNVSI